MSFKPTHLIILVSTLATILLGVPKLEARIQPVITTPSGESFLEEYIWDQNGRLVVMATVGQTPVEFYWLDSNHLKSSVQGSQIESYTYLPGSEYRIQRTDHSGHTHYALFDGVNEIEISTSPYSLGTTSVAMPDFWDQRLSNSHKNTSLAQHLLIDEFGTVHATLQTTGLQNLSYRAFGALLDAEHEGNAWKFTNRPRFHPQ